MAVSAQLTTLLLCALAPAFRLDLLSQKESACLRPAHLAQIMDPLAINYLDPLASMNLDARISANVLV